MKTEIGRMAAGLGAWLFGDLIEWARWHPVMSHGLNFLFSLACGGVVAADRFDLWWVPALASLGIWVVASVDLKADAVERAERVKRSLLIQKS